jgi:hypothetical protein
MERGGGEKGEGGGEEGRGAGERRERVGGEDILLYF